MMSLGEITVCGSLEQLKSLFSYENITRRQIIRGRFESWNCTSFIESDTDYIKFGCASGGGGSSAASLRDAVSGGEFCVCDKRIVGSRFLSYRNDSKDDREDPDLKNTDDTHYYVSEADAVSNPVYEGHTHNPLNVFDPLSGIDVSACYGTWSAAPEVPIGGPLPAAPQASNSVASEELAEKREGKVEVVGAQDAKPRIHSRSCVLL